MPKAKKGLARRLYQRHSDDEAPELSEGYRPEHQGDGHGDEDHQGGADGVQHPE